MYWQKAVFISVLALVAGLANAQVHRCKDASGKLIFSDRPCDADQSGGQVLRKRTQAEILQEREQAYEAESRKQDRRISEQEREFAEQERRLRQQQAQPQVQQSGNDWQSRKDRENAATSARSITNAGGRWDANTQAERSAKNREEMRKRGPEPEPEPDEFRVKSCNANGCIDTRGGTYTGGMIMRRHDGRRCSRSGNTIVCD
jgi:hypothetical protein